MTAPMNSPARKVIARNVRRLRIAQGWKQADATVALSESGIHWSVATWSAMERSVDTDRVRSFTADEIAALAQMFGVKPGDLFEEFECPRCAGSPPKGFICAACGTGGA